jgi:hypothetical protein
MLHILIRLNQILLKKLSFCAQVIFKVPSINKFPTVKKIDFLINSVLDVPDSGHLPTSTENFHKFRVLISFVGTGRTNNPIL